MWTCYRTDRDTPRRRTCVGWARTHDGDSLLALRIGMLMGVIIGEVAKAIIDCPGGGLGGWSGH